MITELRDYIRDTMTLVDSSLRWDRDVFDLDNNSTNIIDKEYKIVFGDAQPQRIDTDYQMNLPCIVRIYKGTGNATRDEDYDHIYCKGIEFAAKVSQQERLTQTGILKDVTATATSPIPIEDNDNMIQISIQLNLLVCFDVI